MTNYKRCAIPCTNSLPGVFHADKVIVQLEDMRLIVGRYKEERWGIYDDTADVDRAVILSDAYYGDGSSVVQMYQETGKPVMIQNAEIVTDTLAQQNIGVW